MKIIDAVWEKRNLGIDVVEIEFELEDRVSDIEAGLAEVSGDYLVAKVLEGQGEILDYVQQKGFRFVEDMIGVKHDLHPIVRNKIYQRIYDLASYHEMNAEELEELYDEINRGMFSRDRISMDERFTKEQSCNRYINWVKDLLARGAKPYVITYKTDHTGFVILQTKDGVNYDSVLGGAYEKFRNTGFGIVQKEQEIVKQLGGKSVSTNVSTNNTSQLKALVSNGYVPYRCTHILVKKN